MVDCRSHRLGIGTMSMQHQDHNLSLKGSWPDAISSCSFGRQGGILPTRDDTQNEARHGLSTCAVVAWLEQRLKAFCILGPIVLWVIVPKVQDTFDHCWGQNYVDETNISVSKNGSSACVCIMHRNFAAQILCENARKYIVYFTISLHRLGYNIYENIS